MLRHPRHSEHHSAFVAHSKTELIGVSLGLYQFGVKTAKHYFCKQCGIYPFHESSRKAGHYRVNLGCIDGMDTFALDADVFDGKNLS